MENLSVRQLNAIVDAYPDNNAMQKDRRNTLIVASRLPALLSYADSSLLDDEEIALTAVKNDGQTLRFFSERIRSMENIVLTAVNNFCKSFSFAVGEARQSIEIAKAVARRGGDTIALLDKQFLESVEIAQIAVNRNPRSLVYFSENVRCDENLALYVVSKDRTAVEFVADSAFKNKRVFEKVLRITDGKISAGVLNSSTPIGAFDEIERRGLKFTLAAQNLDLLNLDRDRLAVCLKCGIGSVVKKGELLRKYVAKEDVELVTLIIERAPFSPKVLLEEVKFASQNRKLRVLPILLKKTGGINVKAVKEKDERMFTLRSLRRKSPIAVERFKENYRNHLNDKEVMYLAGEADGTVLKTLIDTEYAKDEEFITICLKSYIVKNSDGAILNGLGLVLTDEQAKIACQKDGRNYYYLTENQKQNVDIAILAVRSVESVYDNLPDDLKLNPRVKRERDLWIR